MKYLIFKYGVVLFIILSGFKYLEFQFFSHKIPLEIYIAIVSTIFLLAGFFFAKYWIFKKLADNDARTDDSLAADNHSKEEDQSTTLDQEKLSQFSQREQDVLQLLCHGYANKEIAASLNISPNTVKTHMSRLFAKLDVHNRTEALSEAKALNLIA